MLIGVRIQLPSTAGCGRANGELFFYEYKILVMLDELVSDICYSIQCLELKISHTLRLIKSIQLMFNLLSAYPEKYKHKQKAQGNFEGGV